MLNLQISDQMSKWYMHLQSFLQHKLQHLFNKYSTFVLKRSWSSQNYIGMAWYDTINSKIIGTVVAIILIEINLLTKRERWYSKYLWCHFYCSTLHRVRAAKSKTWMMEIQVSPCFLNIKNKLRNLKAPPVDTFLQGINFCFRRQKLVLTRQV